MTSVSVPSLGRLLSVTSVPECSVAGQSLGASLAFPHYPGQWRRVDTEPGPSGYKPWILVIKWLEVGISVFGRFWPNVLYVVRASILTLQCPLWVEIFREWLSLLAWLGLGVQEYNCSFCKFPTNPLVFSPTLHHCPPEFHAAWFPRWGSGVKSVHPWVSLW